MSMRRDILAMISSTIDDLGAERDAVDRAIRDFKFERFRSESMGSLSRSPREVCEEAARECDIFILILGSRYGWVIPEVGVSVVESEYEVARQTNPAKILVYVTQHKDREDRQERLIRRVTDYTTGYFRARPFGDPDELAKMLKEDLANWISDRIAASGGRATDLLGLPSVRTALRSSLWLLLAVVLVVIGLDIAGRTGKLRAPYRLETQPFTETIRHEWEWLPQHTAQFIVAIAKTGLLGLIATGLVLAIIVAVPRGQLIIKQVIVLATFSATYFFFYAAPYLGNTPETMAVDQICGASVAVALLLYLASREDVAGRNVPRLHQFWDRIRLIMLSRELPLVFLAVTGVFVVWNVVNWSEVQLVINFRTAQANGDTPSGMVSGVVIALVTITGVVIIRTTQAVYGAAYIRSVIERRTA